ncbi:MAG: murein biosynthesis integral membrane protein MurJ, partial [bacterium]
MLKRFFNSQAKNQTFAALIIGAATFLNGLLGFARDRLFASHFGAGDTLDIYFSAFRIPDFIYTLLFASGMIFVFLPMFSEYFHKEEKKAWYFTNLVLNSFLVFAGFLCLVCAVLAPLIITMIAPGFSGEKREAVIQLSRLMLLSPFFFIISNIFSGILQYFDRFLVYATAPILYNVGIITGILVFYPLVGIKGLALGVIFGAFLHMAIQIPSAIASGFKYAPIFNLHSPELKRVFVLLLPRTLGAASSQINTVVITAFASTLLSGSVAIFNFANNLRGFPIVLIGLSLATATFPYLSRTWARGEKKEFLESLFSSFRQTLFLIIPTSVFMFFLSTPLVKLILGGGRFGAIDT